MGHRVLVVCGGNTCRSPVLALLLLREMHRAGHGDVEIVSAGSSEHFSMHPRYAGPLNQFAVEALRETLDPVIDVHADEIVGIARAHWSHGLSCFSSQRFDLIVFLDRRYESKPAKWGIVTRTTHTRRIKDQAYRVWRDAGKPRSLEEDHRDGEILRAYRRQTALLAQYAKYLVSHVISPLASE